MRIWFGLIAGFLGAALAEPLAELFADGVGVGRSTSLRIAWNSRSASGCFHWTRFLSFSYGS